MYARVSVFKGSGEEFDDATRNAKDNVLPALRRMEGFAGALILADRSTGRSMSVTLWDSEEALRSSERAADRMREETAATYDEDIVAVETYDIVIDERGGAR